MAYSDFIMEKLISLLIFYYFLFIIRNRITVWISKIGLFPYNYLSMLLFYLAFNSHIHFLIFLIFFKLKTNKSITVRVNV